MKIACFILFLAIGMHSFGVPTECPKCSDTKLKMLYNGLDPTSISQHLAFYELYKNYPYGQKALRDAWKLLAGSSSSPYPLSETIPLSIESINNLISLVNKPLNQEFTSLNENVIKAFSSLSTRLHHHTLKGHFVWNEADFLSLPLEEIDLARGLFLSQFGQCKQTIQSYETLIDLMALQILARLSNDPSPMEKITAINTFIFDEMGFRFPPHSLYAKEIDLYTFLPSVLDSRRGVCLGVSILYLCLAQRLALPLEMITPPGHIYVRYNEGHQMINIETTARGIHIDSEEYLSINTCALQKRTLREVIGLVQFNQASVYLQNGEYAKALNAYKKGELFMPNDPLLKELMGYTLLLTGQKQEGEQKLREIKDWDSNYSISKSTTPEDYLLGRIDPNGIAAIFMRVDEDRQSIIRKKEILEKILKIYPFFRSGILNLAITWLQLHRAGEALEILHNYQTIDPKDPEVHYYLSVLYGQRNNFPKAWFHLQQAEAITQAHDYHPKILKELRRELLTCSPE